jgi:hypothetical protein
VLQKERPHVTQKERPHVTQRSLKTAYMKIINEEGTFTRDSKEVHDTEKEC